MFHTQLFGIKTNIHCKFVETLYKIYIYIKQLHSFTEIINMVQRVLSKRLKDLKYSQWFKCDLLVF